MQDKRFYPYLFLHAGIVTLWVILDRTHKGIANDGAQELYISERTLYNHIQSIYDKLGAKNAIEAYNKAIALGYITPLI